MVGLVDVACVVGGRQFDFATMPGIRCCLCTLLQPLAVMFLFDCLLFANTRRAKSSHQYPRESSAKFHAASSRRNCRRKICCRRRRHSRSRRSPFGVRTRLTSTYKPHASLKGFRLLKVVSTTKLLHRLSLDAKICKRKASCSANVLTWIVVMLFMQANDHETKSVCLDWNIGTIWILVGSWSISHCAERFGRPSPCQYAFSGGDAPTTTHIATGA